MEALHHILSGQSMTRGQLIGAGIFVLTWFVMDVIQFLDMVRGWFQ